MFIGPTGVQRPVGEWGEVEDIRVERDDGFPLVEGWYL